MIYINPPRHSLQAAHAVDTALATAAYAPRTSLHSGLKASPGALVFQRDMLLDIPLLADFEVLRIKQQQIIERNLERSNSKRVDHDYNLGDRCLKLVYKPNKLDP